MSHTVSDHSLGTWEDRMTPRPKVEPPIVHLRTLWAMTREPNKAITAAIFKTTYGHELRVTYGSDDNLLDSLLSRTDDAPLEQRAAELRAVLEEKGWSPVPA